MKSPELDRERIETLARDILLMIRANYQRGPISRNRVYEALNALAFSTALVIKGCDDPNAEAVEFFNKAVKQHLEQ